MKRKNILSVAVCLIMVVALLAATPLAASATNTTAAGRTGTIAKGTQVYEEADSEADSYTTIGSYTITVDEEITVDGELWYKYSCSELFALFFKGSYPYVKAADVTLEDSGESGGDSGSESSDETTLESTVDGIGINVKGNIPEGVTLSAEKAENAAYAEYVNAEDVAVAMDIKLLKEDGSEWQPYEDDATVGVSIDVSSTDLEDGDIVTLTHIHDGKSEQYTYVVIDKQLTFYTDSFSIYMVSKVLDTSGEKIDTSRNYDMNVGDERTFYCAPSLNEGEYVLGVVWAVGDDANTVNYTVYDNNGYQEGSDYWTWKAPWITVRAQNAGDVTVTATVYYSQHGQKNSTTETFNINVSEKEGFHICDRIAETGCLVPTWGDTENKPDNVSYTWTRNDNQAIRSEALNEDGSVNVSLDRGGVTNTREPITYTVKANYGGSTAQDSFRILYGQEILNPSFETPDLTSISRNYNHLAVYNGYNGLYWKTTAPGTGSVLGQDVELGATDNGTNPYGITSTVDDGKQFAELNAENIGTLYQDMLTTSGATLTWSFSHAARYDGDSTKGATTMYIVIGASKNAKSIVSETEIKNLIKAAKDESNTIPEASSATAIVKTSGLKFTYNEGTYYIWKHTATNDKENPWSTLSGEYKVPEGQYLTRLFFASDPDNTENKTLGNLIDGVDAGEKMSYKIEYYPDGNIANDKTESGNGTVYTTVNLNNLQEYMNEGYVITNVKVNGKDYSGNISSGLYITDYGSVEEQTENILVKITLKKRAITVTKKVTVENWENLTDDEKTKLIKDYKASFSLYEKGKNEPVATTTLTVSNIGSDGTISVLGELQPKNGNVQNGEYTIKETSASEISGYELESTTYSGGEFVDGGVSVEISNENPTAAVICTNGYKVGLADLTITKKGIMPVDHDDSYLTVSDNSSLESQSTIFKVTGPDYSQEVVICGNGSVTIKGLPIGKYTVTEVTDWSWRYTPVDSNKKKEIQQNVTITAAGGNVMFINSRITDGDTNHWKWLNGGAYCKNLFKENSTDN